MEDFQNYDKLCIISLCSDRLNFEIGDLNYFGDGYGNNCNYATDIMYDKQTGGFIELELFDKPKPDDTKDGVIYIENIIHKLVDLYSAHKSQKYDFLNDNNYLIICKYFEDCLGKLSRTVGTPREKLYFVILTENDWAIDSNMIDTILTPLIKRGSNEDEFTKVTHATRLEGSLLNFQFNEELRKKVPAFIQNENQCILYDIYVDKNTVELQSIVFQVKEDYNLRLFNEKYYVPKVTSIHNSSNLNDINLQEAFEQLIITDLLQIDGLSKKSLPDRYRGEIDTAYGFVLDVVLYNICTYLEKGNDVDFVDYVRGHEGYLKNYLNEQQGTRIRSTAFLRKTIEELSLLLSDQLSKAIDFIEAQNKKVPFIKKSIIVNGNVARKGWPQYIFSRTFFFLLQQAFEKRYDKQDVTNWHFLSKAAGDNAIVSGIFSSISRKAMIANIGLPPVVIEEYGVLNGIGLPLHYELVDGAKRNMLSLPSLKSIVYIDISCSSTMMVCEIIDKHGLVKEQFDINIPDKRLSSITVFLNSTKNYELFSGSGEDGTRLELPTPITSSDYSSESSSNIPHIRPYLQAYLERLISYLNSCLRSKLLSGEKTTFVLSLDKQIMNTFQMKSSDDLSEFIEAQGIIDTKDNPRRVIIRDRGEKLVWYMLKDTVKKPPFYYVHSNISDNYVHVKIHRVIKISATNEGTGDSPSILIKEKTISIKNIYEQVSEKLWHHIQTLDHQEKGEFIHSIDANSIDAAGCFKVFSKKIIQFIKEELLGDQHIQKYFSMYDSTRKFKISKYSSVTLTIRQLIQLAIIPVLQNMASLIISCLLDDDFGGYYEISKLFVTGDCLPVKKYSYIYQYIVTTELKKNFKELLREKTHRTEFYILVDTCKQDQPRHKTSLGHKAFCYNIIVKGEPRVVSSSTYLAGNSRALYTSTFKLGRSCSKYGNFYSLMLRGNELEEKRLQLIRGFSYNTYLRKLVGSDAIEMHKYPEPCTIEEIKNAKQVLDAEPTLYTLMAIDKANSLATIQIEVLHYCSCIRFTSEYHYGYYGKKMLTEESTFLFGERLTIKYF